LYNKQTEKYTQTETDTQADKVKQRGRHNKILTTRHSAQHNDIFCSITTLSIKYNQNKPDASIIKLTMAVINSVT